MQSPVESIEVSCESDGKNFDLVSRLNPDFLAVLGKNTPVPDGLYKIHENEIVRNLAIKYAGYTPGGELVERAGNYIITTPNGNRFLIGREGSLSIIRVSSGVTDDIFSGKIRVFPAPEVNKEKFDSVLSDYAQVIKDLAEEFYTYFGLLSPEELLIIGPPKEKVAIKGNGGVTPSELLGKLEIERPNVRFEDIGGQPEAKREIEGLAFALKNPDLYKKWGTKPPKGVLLYGPPGTGKTLMAKALASQAEARFLHVEASDIASKWYGESESIVKQIFDLAGKNGEKTILFFDEVDAIAPHRDNAHEATQKVLSTILENMDGLSSNENVMVVASTNRLQFIDPALTRAGRFDRWVEVPLPDVEGRKQIFGIHITKTQELAGRQLFDAVDIETIVSRTEGSSGADIAEVIRRVLEEKVRQEGAGGQPSLVTTGEIMQQIKEYERVQVTKKQIGFARPTSEQS